MSAAYKIIIPVRFGATRLPGKPLLEIGDRPLVQHVYEAARRSHAAAVIIATDDERIAATARGFGADVAVTGSHHVSGTDRVAEAAAILGEADDGIIVNLQGDEFALPPELPDQVADLLAAHGQAQMATLSQRIESEAEWRDPNVVKVVADRRGRALYFSRAQIPFGGDPGSSAGSFRHIGIYAYRAGFLRTLSGLPPADLELSERLEQLRVLYHGYTIQVAVARARPGIEVNTPADLERARAACAAAT